MRFLNIKTWVLIILCVVLMNSLVLGSKVVREIKIQGLENVKPSVVKSKIKTKRKKILSKKQINKDIKEILSTGFFTDVEVKLEDMPDGVAVIFQLKEKPIVRKILFQGNESISKGQLRDVMKLKSKAAYDEFSLKQDEKAIVKVYKEKGFFDVKVESFPSFDEDTKEVEVSFYISEGKQIKIQDIFIVGNKAIKKKKILKALSIKKKKVFKEEVLERGLVNVERLYKNKGYLDVKITERDRVLDGTHENIIININIDEGSPYKIGSMTFSGNKEFTDKELLKGFSLKKGELYNQDDFEKCIVVTQEMYAEKGYIQVDVRPEIKQEKGIVDVKFMISENDIVYINKIYIEGNKITRPYVIRREFLVKPQDPFNVKKVRRSQEKIYNLGFFQDVQIDLDQISANKVDLIFSVVEQQTGLASIGAGYSSEDGLMGTIQFSKINLFGKGQKINLLWEFGATRQNYQISFHDPYFFRTYTSFGIDIFDMLRRRDYIYEDTNSLEVYSEKHQGGAIRFGRKFYDVYSASLGYGFDRVKIFDVADLISPNTDTTLIDEQNKGEQDTSSLSLSLSRDTRNNVFYPKRGSYSNLSAKIAGSILGGDNNFTKFLLSHSFFVSTFWKFVFAVNAEAGLVTYFSPSSEVPLYERFYVGGAESVRGYDYRGDIGPESGGLYKFVYNVEYKFPIVEERGNSILQGAFFCDVGGAWDRKEDVTLKIGRDDNYMKIGVGFGIRFTTPAFPIRLDWGYGLNKKEGEEPSQFYFTIGQLF